MKHSKAYAPRKMRDNNRPTQTMEPNPDPLKRGPKQRASLDYYNHHQPPIFQVGGLLGGHEKFNGALKP